jgi:hypothetical protein
MVVLELFVDIILLGVLSNPWPLLSGAVRLRARKRVCQQRLGMVLSGKIPGLFAAGYRSPRGDFIRL